MFWVLEGVRDEQAAEEFCLKNIKNAQKFIAGDGKVAWLLNSLRLLYNHKLQKGR